MTKVTSTKMQPQLRILSALLFILTFRFMPCAAQCNTCVTANSMACYSATQMQTCTNGVPSATPTDCPSGYVCVSTANGVLCQVSSTAVTPACNDCHKCDATKTFACTGTNTFALCVNSETPTTMTGTCSTGFVCNTANEFICAKSYDGVVPSCSYADDTTTTTTTTNTPTTPTAAPPTPTGYCAALQQRGRFPYGTNVNTTCKQYINCYPLNGSWRGDLYTCPGETYFDSALQHCTTAVPARCTAAVASLRLNGLALN